MIILMFPLAKAVSSEGNTHGSRLSVVSCVCHVMAIGKMRMCGRTDLQIFERIRVKIMDLD